MSSEDEQDDNNGGIFDQLKSIKPFTIEQLYMLHPDVGCPPSSKSTQPIATLVPLQDASSGSNTFHDRDLYQNLIDFEQLRIKLVELKSLIKRLHKKTFDHVDKVWHLKEESLRRIGMCQQGKIAETTYKYKQAFLNAKQLDTFTMSFRELVEIINKEYIYYSFESQMKRQRIATQLSVSYQINDVIEREKKLKVAIATLIDFLKHLGDNKSEFVVQCRKWLRGLIKRFLESEKTTENCKFIIAQISRGPAGTADWSADLIECKPFDKILGTFESAPQYISHCSALLSELFNCLKIRIGAIEGITKSSSSDNEGQLKSRRAIATAQQSEFTSDVTDPPTMSNSQDQNWSLIDPRFSCSEELNLSSASGNLLSECDVIKLCLRIPVVQIFRAYVKKCLDSDELRLETDKSYETIMLKLLTIGTIIIKTYQIGLETFDSIQYGNLIEYLSSQIRRTVIVLSEQWNEFKRRLRGVDDALLMRLQVEYDNFILRSILIILELRQSGIWRHLSRVEPDYDNLMRGDESSNSWSAESLRPAFMKLLQATGLSSQTASPNTAETPPSPNSRNLSSADNDQRQLDQSVRCLNLQSLTSLTYEFSTEWFSEVSEPMLWHILWQFYHNAFTSSCDYHSDKYWLQKFREKSVTYLFVNKIRDSPPGECSYLLNSITSMVLSRSRQDSRLVNFIATEVFNLAFIHETTREKVSKKGIRSLVRCAEKFPNLISTYLQYMMVDHGSELNENIVDLMKGCNLNGWLCSEEEFNLLAHWLNETPITSARNQISRLILTKILLNSPEHPEINQSNSRDGNASSSSSVILNESILSAHRNSLSRGRNNSKARTQNRDCFVDLKLRRKIALALFEACKQHLPESTDISPTSLGASVEVAFERLYCEKGSNTYDNLIGLCTDTTYQQFYVWSWRILFTLRLHILNQPETDWNDVQIRSGTSRSIKNTVLFDDCFHPVPSIQDSECLSLSEGIKNENPLASFVYLLLTDVTWQEDTLGTCLNHLNIMAKSGHLTPSLMAMGFFTICHLNNLNEKIAKDTKCQQFFTTIILSNFDSTRLASLIMSQLDQLKRYRQLQISQFYIKVMNEVAAIIDKQVSASWLSSNEHCLEKVACLLDYIVKFNFSFQRADIIRKFYESSYSVQTPSASGSWFGSLFLTNSLNANSTRREFLTNLHLLTQKYKKYTWLRWVTTECDTLRLEKIWEDIVVELSYNEDSSLDAAIKKVCPQVNSSMLKSILPINSWIKQIFDVMESDLSHPLCPLIWYNFYLNYFANSLNGVSVGLKLVPPETLTKLMSRLDSLINYHLFKHRSWGNNASSNVQQNSLAQLYRAYRLWLQDPSLRDAYVDIDRLKENYLVPLLKSVMESSTENACLQYIDVQSIETQNSNLIQVWSTATTLCGNQLLKKMIFVESNQDESMAILTSVEDEASDAVSLLAKPMFSNNATPAPEANRLLANAEEELRGPMNGNNQVARGGNFASLMDNSPTEASYRTLDETIHFVQQHFHTIFDESSMFAANLGELDKTTTELMELIRNLYSNKKREIIRVVPCVEGHECPGPARIKFEIEEATLDERKSQGIQDRRRQCEEVVLELLLMPTLKIVQSTVAIEDAVKHVVNDPARAKQLIETLLTWISDSKAFDQLNGPYYPANHLLKSVLDIMSFSEHRDAYNEELVDICLAHSGSVQILSPFLSPSTCSTECFLELYKRIGTNQLVLGPIAMFVMLSKFDVNSWLKLIKSNKSLHHELIKATCYAFGCMGKEPDDSFALTFELYKRHLHLELASPDRRKPEEVALVLNEFLRYMEEQSLAPSLWLDFLSIIGLERHAEIKSNQKQFPDNISRSTISPLKSEANSGSLASPMLNELNYEQSLANSTEIYDDLTNLAENQMILDLHSLNELMLLLNRFIEAKRGTTNVTLLEIFNDYLEKFNLVLMSITFMWLKSMANQFSDNHALIWKQNIDIWYDWVFLTKNCQNVGMTSYNLMANNFVSTLKFMIYCFEENTQQILQSTLTTLTEYVIQTKGVIYLELTILQHCLEELSWSKLMASPKDFDNLALLAEQNNYNMSSLVSHILLQLNTKDCLTSIHEQLRAASSRDDDPEIYSTLSHVAERLATTIILQANRLKGFRLFGGYFTLIPVSQVTRIASLILPRMEFVNLEHSQTNKLLVNLLRLMCIKLDLTNNDNNEIQSSRAISQNIRASSTDNLDRSIVYAQFVSNYLIDLIKNHPTVLQHHEAYLKAVIDNSLQDLKNLLSPDVDMSQKTVIYDNLLECCSCEHLSHESRMYLVKCLLDSELVKSRPIVMMELFHAIGKILRDGAILVFAVERLITLYLRLNGHYEKVLKSFSLKILPSDLYLGACIEDNAPLALLVYFESLYRNGLDTSQTSESLGKFQSVNNNKIWSSFFHWISRLSTTTATTTSPRQQSINQATPITGGDSQSFEAECLSNEAKLSIAWLRLIDLMEFNLQQFVSNELGARQVTKAEVSNAKSETESLSSQSSRSSQANSTKGSISANTTAQQSSTSSSSSSSSPKLLSSHKSLVNFIKKLVSIYDSSIAGGLWSYLKYPRSYESSRISLIALSIACFLSDRTMICLNLDQPATGGAEGDAAATAARRNSASTSALREEISKYRKSCLTKLEAARRSKQNVDHVQFIEALIESVNQNDKVQYSEGVQLITTFVKSTFRKTRLSGSGSGGASMNSPALSNANSPLVKNNEIDMICMDKILP